MRLPLVLDRMLHKGPDIRSLVRDRDCAALIRLLGSWDQDLVTEAVHALGMLGSEATGPLLAALGKKGRDVRLGIISALAEIRDPRAVSSLIRMLKDRSSEVRWQAAIALGENR